MSVFRVILVRVFQHLDCIRRDTPYLSVFSPKVGKCGPESLRIQTLFMQWRVRAERLLLKMHYGYSKPLFHRFSLCDWTLICNFLSSSTTFWQNLILFYPFHAQCCKMAKHTLKILRCLHHTARFLKYVWPFYNIMHVRVNLFHTTFFFDNH